MEIPGTWSWNGRQLGSDTKEETAWSLLMFLKALISLGQWSQTRTDFLKWLYSVDGLEMKGHLVTLGEDTVLSLLVSWNIALHIGRVILRLGQSFFLSLQSYTWAVTRVLQVCRIIIRTELFKLLSYTQTMILKWKVAYWQHQGETFHSD